MVVATVHFLKACYQGKGEQINIFVIQNKRRKISIVSNDEYALWKRE